MVWKMSDGLVIPMIPFLTLGRLTFSVLTRVSFPRRGSDSEVSVLQRVPFPMAWIAGGGAVSPRVSFPEPSPLLPRYLAWSAATKEALST